MTARCSNSQTQVICEAQKEMAGQCSGTTLCYMNDVGVCMCK